MTSAFEVPPSADVPPSVAASFSLGVGGPLGFGGNVSPAKLAFVHGLAERPYAAGRAAGPGGAARVLEVRIHGVGGSSPGQLLEQAEYVQVGGDDLAQFIRRWGGRLRIVPWPLEGYWWGGLTSRPATRALWSLLFPLLLCNLAAWMAPAPPRGTASDCRLLRFAGACLAVTLRWTGYVLTLVLTASVASASLDTLGWQCTGPDGSGSCHARWLGWMPDGAGPRMTLFALVPVVVLAVLGYAGLRTISSYERWRIRSTVKAGVLAEQAWPLAAEGFWHGQWPVRRLLPLHLAGAAGLLGLYLAWVPASHPGWRTATITAAFAIIFVSGMLLACPRAARPGANPYARAPTAAQRAASDKAGGFDVAAWTVLAVSAALLGALVLARLWWRPEGPPAKGYPGVLPGDAGIWVGLTIAMGVLVAAAFLLTLAVKAIIWAVTRGARRAGRAAGAGRGNPRFRPFAGGLLGPAALCLACVTGGILAAGVNLAIPRLLIGSAFRVGPAYPGRSPAYPVEVAWPLFGFMLGLIGVLAALILTAAGYALPRFFQHACATMSKLDCYYEDAKFGSKAQRWRIAWQWSVSRAADLMGFAFAVMAVGGLAGVIAFYHFDSRTSFLEGLIGFQQWLVGAGAVALYGYTLSAFRNQGTRTRIQMLWDVGTFWPRACQPFAPPCYAERSVPELVNRLDSLLGPADAGTADRLAQEIAAQCVARLAPNLDEEKLVRELGELTPRYDQILINGYSQGAPIAAAAIAQLPVNHVKAISLLTAGSPLRRLYGRAFPAYFGPDCLADLLKLLTDLDHVRWRNAVRNSDYIGGFTFCDPYGEKIRNDLPVDKAVLDPVCVVPGDGDNATVPVIHGHSDFWPDPQVALLTRSLIESALHQGGPAVNCAQPTAQSQPGGL